MLFGETCPRCGRRDVLVATPRQYWGACAQHGRWLCSIPANVTPAAITPDEAEKAGVWQLKNITTALRRQQWAAAIEGEG